MQFIAQFKDGGSFSGKDGYWDDCPDRGITALHLTLPFSIKKRGENGEVIELDPSTVMISGYEAYYCANMAQETVLSIGGMVDSKKPKYIGITMAGIDYTHDFVLSIFIDTRGNVTHRRYTVKKFMEGLQIAPTALRKGA